MANFQKLINIEKNIPFESLSLGFFFVKIGIILFLFCSPSFAPLSRSHFFLFIWHFVSCQADSESLIEFVAKWCDFSVPCNSIIVTWHLEDWRVFYFLIDVLIWRELFRLFSQLFQNIAAYWLRRFFTHLSDYHIHFL